LEVLFPCPPLPLFPYPVLSRPVFPSPLLLPCLPSILPLSLPLEIGPLNPASGSGNAISSVSRVCGRAPAENEFGAF